MTAVVKHKQIDKKSTSVLASCGLRLVKTVTTTEKDSTTVVSKIVLDYFVCTVGACYHKDGIEHGHKIKLAKGGTTGSATRHLSSMHGIVSSKTVATKVNSAKLSNKIEGANPGYHGDPGRFFGNAFAVLSANHGISFNTFKSDTWNTIAHHLPTAAKGELKNPNMRLYSVEQYHYMKRSIVAKIQEARTLYGGVPFVSLNVDLYQDKVSNMKYVGLRISWW